MGLLVDADVYNELLEDVTAPRFYDDISGFIDVVAGGAGGFVDTMNIAWSADNDGDPVSNSAYFPETPSSVLGVRILRAPSQGAPTFNWWAWRLTDDAYIPNWGPCRRTNGLAYGLNSRGMPFGDRARYRMLTNGEQDYDQVFSAIDYRAEGWAPPLADVAAASDVADGLNTEFLLSYGPFDPIAPGDSVPFTFALIAGAGLHRDPSNFARRFDFRHPQDYLNNLDFSDLILNARWADWYFDTPGFDTDGDGNRGRAYLVNCEGGKCDSIFYKGDGVPDLRGPSSPPAPGDFALVTKPGQAILRWSGAFTELEQDNLSGRRDFEGYRVYVGKIDRDDQFSLLASWDREDYKRFAYDQEKGAWFQISDPRTMQEWQAILGEPSFNPNDYIIPTIASAYRDSVVDTLRNHLGDIVRITSQERLSYWTTEDFNRGNEYWDSGHRESNPIQRVEERDTVILGEQLTYGVYETIIDNLNPSVPLFFAVTAFDFGNYELDLPPLASSPANNSKYGEPIYSSDVVIDSGLRVSVFPNPYKISYPDAWGKETTYYLEGYEGRSVRDFADQDRRIHFINLPDTATIRIFSLDGDLIREIHHPDQFLTTYSSSVGWDLISRNTQAVVSGIYIWRVDSRLGTQVGKLVIIK